MCRLMEELCQNQLSADGTTPPPRTDWAVGSECIALRDDGRWYRAKVTDVSDDLLRVTNSVVFHFH